MWRFGKEAILLLFLNALHVHCETVLKIQNINETDSHISLQGDGSVGSDCYSDKYCLYPLICEKRTDEKEKVCSPPKCNNESKCEYSLKCENQGDGVGNVCTLQKCANDTECEFPLKCEFLGADVGKACSNHLKSCKTFKGDGLCDSRLRVRRPRNVGRKVQSEDVLAYALSHPQSSTKMISENCGLSKSRVWTILNESGAHPYRSTPVQVLLARDAERRYTCCNFVMNNIEDHLTFRVDLIWADEACF
ncbi:hypothetical protein AVEN_220443-1 [Araneus ventricosus]|uniref:Uncharacterized protein n=1 Tax=Araneus ventricosus TaxID=182803 RepID=A0A4Y2IPV3_ARAVE|nr:hypothetical protein AVEN_220443-1 [Araneus ventricosus]